MTYGLGQSQTSPPKTRLSSEEAQEDLHFLYKTLQESHYDLFANTEKRVFDEQFSKLKTSFTDSSETFDFHIAIQKFTALAGHAHCSSGYPFATSYSPYIQAGGTLFPLGIYLNKKKVYTAQNYSTNGDISIGHEILSVNEIPITEVMGGIYEYLSGESIYFKNSLIDLIEFPRLYWLVYGEGESFTLKLREPKSGKVSEFTVKAVLASEMEDHFATKTPLFNHEREFYYLDEIAYLRPGIFLNQEAEVNTSEQNTFDRGEFQTFIDASFQEIISKNTQHLIIDLRGNSGGDNSFSDIMLSYFADKPFWFCSQFLVRTSETTKKFWQDVKMKNLQDMREQILSLENGEQFEASFEDYEPKPDSLRYKGQVYVLIDRYSFSNTVATAAIIKDYGFGTILGEITADTPSSFGAVHQFNLPHSQIAITYPKALIVRPNGNETLIGVKPDIPLKEIQGNGKDDILDRTIDLIRRKEN